MNFGTLGVGFGGMGRVGAVSSLAATLLAGESQGLAFVASDQSMSIIDTGTPANNYAGDLRTKLGTSVRASNAYYYAADGTLTLDTSGRIRLDYDPRLTGGPGYLVEEARTNVVLQNRDLTNAAWTKSNTTAAKDQTGPDGVANSASSLTATAGNGTCLQAITLASSARYQSCYIKRITGTGNVQMTMDNGTTWTTVTVTSAWTAVEIPTQTLANPTVGFRIVTNGDAVAIDLVQNENGTFRTSAIATVGSTVTRAKDIPTLGTSLAPFSTSAVTLFAEYVLPLSSSSISTYSTLVGHDFSGNDQLIFMASGTSGGDLRCHYGTGIGVVVVQDDVDRSAFSNLKACVSIDASGSALYINGLAAAFGTNAGILATSSGGLWGIGCSAADTSHIYTLNGWIKRLMILPVAISNATKAALTA